jgi:hypothetical protein
MVTPLSTPPNRLGREENMENYKPRFAHRLTPIGISLLLTLVLALSLLQLLSAYSSAGVLTSAAADYWLAFPPNYQYQELSVLASGVSSTTGTVRIPGLGWSSGFSVTPGSTTVITLPDTQLYTSDSIADRGVHVTAAADIAVYGLNHADNSTDGYFALPTGALGTEYIVLGYSNSTGVTGTQFAILATEDGTSVAIWPSVATDGHAAGVQYNIGLDQGEVYFLRNSDSGASDLSGTLISSDKPVAVFGSHRCADVPSAYDYCSHLVEQLTPVSTWGKSFVAMPLRTRTDYTLRVLASVDNTTVVVNGSGFTLHRGNFHEQLLSGPADIAASKPVLVAQYSHGATYDSSSGDPFMMLVPPQEQFLRGYTVSTPASGFANSYVNIVAPDSAVGSITLDGAPIPAGSYTAIGSSGYSGVAYTVTVGAHALAGPQPFGVSVYGFGSHDSYGYLGGVPLSYAYSVYLPLVLSD